jgi:hypothetical protein
MEITRNPYDKAKPLSKVEQYKQKLSQRNENQTWILSNFFGKQGGGAPIKDSSGKTVTKMISVADENIYRLESSEFSKASTQPSTSFPVSSPMPSQSISNNANNTSLPNYITNMSISLSNPNLNLRTLPYVPQPNSTTQYITASNNIIHNPEMYLQHFKQNELTYPPVAPLPYAYPPSYLIPYLYPPPYAVPNYPPYPPHKPQTTQGGQKQTAAISNRGDGRERPSSNRISSGTPVTQYNKDNDDGYCLPEERDDKEHKSDKEAQMLKWQKELNEQIAEKKAREELEKKRLEEEERLEEIKNQEYFEFKNKQREKQEQLRQSKIKQNQQLNESNDGSNINNMNILSNNQFETQIQTTNNNDILQQQLPNQQQHTDLINTNNNSNININSMKQQQHHQQQQQQFISEYDQKEDFKNSIELGLRNINETLTKEYENELHRINNEYNAKLGTITKELMQATDHPDTVYHDVKIQHNKRLNHIQNIIEQRNLISLIFDKPHLETKPPLYYNTNKDLEIQLPSYFGQNVDNATSRYNTLQSQSHFCGFDNAEMSAEYLDEHTKNATVLIEDPTNSDINVKLFGVNDFNYDERRLDNESSFIPLHGNKGEVPTTTTGVHNEEIKGKYLPRQLEQHDKDYNYFNMLNREYNEIQQLSKKINPISKAGMINKEFNIDYNTIKEQNIREALQSNNNV